MELYKVYGDLLHKIVHLKLAPESILNVSVLSKSFDVSRTPVKEALILLQAEGFVIRQGSHFVVTPLSLERIIEITELRGVVEAQANVWAMNRMNSEDVNQLLQLRDEILCLSDQVENRLMVDLDNRFHRLLFQGARNGQVVQLLERLLNHYQRFWLLIPREINRDGFFCETLKIIKAIQDKNESELRRATLAHIKESLDEILEHQI